MKGRAPSASFRQQAFQLTSLSIFLFARPARSFTGPVQLERANFSEYINGLPSTHGVLMEYYAHWCPSCQHFMPTYDKISHYFNAEPRVKPEVLAARVDCATETELCNKMGIGRYPTLKYGLPSAFRDDDKEKPVEYDSERTAKKIIQWVGEQKGVDYNFDATQEFQDDRHSISTAVIGTEAGIPLTADLQDINKATVLAFKYIFDTAELLKGAESREAFQAFVKIVAAAHPEERCRRGAQQLEEAIPKLWPPDQVDGPQEGLKSISVCGQASEESGKEWQACKGSKENTRGFTCGLWMLLHSLAGRLEPKATSGAEWMHAAKGYVKHFFQCSDCANHFMEMASESAANAVQTQRQAVLWAWRAHNEVNRRLEAVEKNSGDGDPAFPKKQWPPSELCPLCRLPLLAKTPEVAWNEEEVYRFLIKFYNGSSEPGWMLGKQDSVPQLSRLGGRRNLELPRSSSSRRKLLPILLVVALLGVIGFLARQRTKRDRKIVSL